MSGSFYLWLLQSYDCLNLYIFPYSQLPQQNDRGGGGWGWMTSYTTCFTSKLWRYSQTSWNINIWQSYICSFANFCLGKHNFAKCTIQCIDDWEIYWLSTQFYFSRSWDRNIRQFWRWEKCCPTLEGETSPFGNYFTYDVPECQRQTI